MTSDSYQSELIKNSHYTMWLEDNVIFIYSVGLWGKSTAERFSQDYTSLRARLNGKPWSVISHSKDWVLGSPDIEPILANLGKPEDNRQLVVSIRIIDENTLSQFQINKITDRIPQNYLRLNFTDEAKAFKSLQEHGFNTKTQSFSACFDI